MRYDWLLEPVSETEPCGPDLDEAGDDEYLNYVLAVVEPHPRAVLSQRHRQALRPHRAQAQGRGRYDRRPLEAVRAICGCCASRRGFRALPANLSGFADCLEAIAGLVGQVLGGRSSQGVRGRLPRCARTMWQVSTIGCRSSSRCSTRTLVRDTPARADHLPPVPGRERRRGEARRRDHPRVRRDPALDCAPTRTAQCPTSATTRPCAPPASLPKIREVFIENSGYDYVPSFDRLAAFLAQLLELFRAARPELAAAAPTAEEAAAAEGAAEADGAAGALAAAAAARRRA